MAKTGALPVYLQISEMLIREIEAGHLLDGERLAPERKMAANMNISVGTLRKALLDLENKGLLERRQGSGNYIKALAAPDSIYAFFRLELHRGGGLPKAKVLDVATCAKPEDAPSFGLSETGHRIRRVRFLDEAPIALEEIWLDASAADRILERELSDSLYLYYKNRLGLWIARAEDRVGTGRMPDWGPDDFQCAPQTHCGFIERMGWDGDNNSVEFSRTWFDADKARYVARLR